MKIQGISKEGLRRIAASKRAQIEEEVGGSGIEMDLHLLVENETEYWQNIPEGIKAIYAAYLFDASKGVNVAEITPSAELWYIDTEPVFEDWVYDEPNEERREELFDYVIEGNADQEQVTYMHMSNVMKIAHPYHKQTVADEEEWEEAIEENLDYLRGNMDWTQYIKG